MCLPLLLPFHLSLVLLPLHLQPECAAEVFLSDLPLYMLPNFDTSLEFRV